MERTVVIYKSKHGSTKQYAEWIGEELDCPVISTDDFSKKDFDSYDNIIFGGCVQAGGIQGFDLIKKAMRWHRLDGKKVITFAVGLNIMQKETRMQLREIKRLYLAVIDGLLEQKYGTIRLPIGRKSDSTIERQIDLVHGENAVTHYCRLRTIGDYTLAAFQLETGRTHQIRVHMASQNTPLVGDTLYNHSPSANALPRQALHAYRISFSHPVTGKHMKFTAPIPNDILSLIP